MWALSTMAIGEMAGLLPFMGCVLYYTDYRRQGIACRTFTMPFLGFAGVTS
jgi:hypothetical protein